MQSSRSILRSDVAIVGAGPAGSIAAICLARRGLPVTLIEQHRFPRDKVCGECLSALGIEVLKRLDLLRPLQALRPILLQHALLHSCDGHTTRSPLPRPMLGISRAALDSFLLDQAKAAGAQIVQPGRVEHIENAQGDGVRLTVRNLQCNTIRDLEASCVLLADGKSSLNHSSPAPTGDLGIKSHWTGIGGGRDAIELYGCQGCYGGIAPIEGGRWNIAFSVPAERMRGKSNLGLVFDKLCSQNQALRERIAGARQVTDWLASPLPRFGVRRHWPARIIPLGNAAASIEPIGGEGIGLAMRSAELAGTALAQTRGVWSKTLSDELRFSFRSLWQKRAVVCRAGAVVASSPTLARLIFPLIAPNESVLQGMLQLAGK